MTRIGEIGLPGGGCSTPRTSRARTPSAFERPVHGDADRRRLGLQPLAGPGRDQVRETPPATTGVYVFFRDVRSGAVWSAGFQPSGGEPDDYQVVFNEERAEFARRDGTLNTTWKCSSRPKTTLKFAAFRSRTPATTSGDRSHFLCRTRAGTPGLRLAHPAFSKLFVETEYLAELEALIATRRRRAPMSPRFGCAVAVVAGEVVGKPEVETDRARFLGRGYDVRRPIAMFDGRRLSNTVGPVLDPVFALRYRLRIPPGSVVHIAYWTVVASSREGLLELVDKHRDTAAFDRAATLGWTQAQVQLRHLSIGAGEATLFQRLAGHLLYAAPALRPSSETIRRGSGSQPVLWRHGIFR